MCPYCEERISYLAYNGDPTFTSTAVSGGSYYCPKCETTITIKRREAYAFMRREWDGRGDMDLYWANHVETRNYTMIHEDNCHHMEHIHCKHGTLEEVYEWAKLKGLPITHCSHCHPPNEGGSPPMSRYEASLRKG